jgi:hypothetical protein
MALDLDAEDLKIPILDRYKSYNNLPLGEDAISKRSLIDQRDADIESQHRDSTEKKNNQEDVSSPDVRNSKNAKFRKTSIFGNFFSKLKSTRNTDAP